MASTINATPTSSGLIQTADSTGVLALQTGGTTAVTISATQNVGIGTASPSSKLEVIGPSSSVGTISWQNQSRKTGYLYSDTSGVAIYATELDNAGIYLVDDDRIAFFANGAERMRIDSSGNLLILTSTVNGNGITISPNASTADNYLMFNNTATSATNIYFRYNGTTVGNISRTTTATTYATSSDYRLKENIAPMTGALATVSALKPVTYKWKIDGSSGQGFIAHELAEVVPDCVTGEKDAVDAEGNPIHQGIDTSFLVATLTAAIQEQQAIITELKTRIEALETK